MPLGVQQGSVQAILKQRAVGQQGQGIVVGQAVNPLFAGFALAHVAEEAHVTDQVAFLVLYRGNTDPGREALAVAPLQPHFALPATALVELAENVVQVAGLLVVGGEHAGQLVEHLRRGVAADPAEGFVDLDDIASRVGDQDRRGGVFEHRGRHTQVFVCAALLADVAADPEQALEAAMSVPHGHHAQFHGNLVAVGAQAVEDQ